MKTVIYDGQQYEAKPMKHNKGKLAFAIKVPMESSLKSQLPAHYQHKNVILIEGRDQFTVV